MIELQNSKTTYLGKTARGRHRFALDCSIGAVQMREPNGKWVDITPRFVWDEQKKRFVSTGTPYHFEIDGDGNRWIWPWWNEQDKYLHFPASELFRHLPKEWTAKKAIAHSPLYDIDFQLTNTGVRFGIAFNDRMPKELPIAFDVEAIGLDVAELLKSKEGLGIPRPRILAGEDEQFLDWQYKNGQLRLVIPPLARPTRFQNTTLDLSVGLSADDDLVRRLNTTLWMNNLTQSIVGNSTSTFKGFGGSMRFTGVNIPAGANLTTAPNSYLTLVSFTSASGTTVRSDLCCENSNNPGQMGSYGDHIGRARTTPVAWDGIAAWTDGTSYQSLDISSCIQEVVDNNAGTGDALIVFLEDKDIESDTGAKRTWAAQDHASYAPPAIHIEYEAAAAGWTGKISGVTNPAKIAGVAVADIATVKGVASS